ncbi:hypothetical protein [Pseudoalteromonas sp. S16_S37]|uniref:hypothetical protein n=1 Tax=Pseudoalteromonas sp. S16_S37 TaxID=2720228 RepID=UPI001680AF39|nr:hypothetical protein [Pseudoalteromonas sp. S16_S37]MBD1584691.1 hypothetical protein [Pseudoalteromonas sp. S16_S37]
MTEQLPRFERKNNGAVVLIVGHADEYGAEQTMTHFLSEKSAQRLLDELTKLEPKRQAEIK